MRAMLVVVAHPSRGDLLHLPPGSANIQASTAFWRKVRLNRSIKALWFGFQGWMW